MRKILIFYLKSLRLPTFNVYLICYKLTLFKFMLKAKHRNIEGDSFLIVHFAMVTARYLITYEFFLHFWRKIANIIP